MEEAEEIDYEDNFLPSHFFAPPEASEVTHSFGRQNYGGLEMPLTQTGRRQIENDLNDCIQNVGHYDHRFQQQSVALQEPTGQHLIQPMDGVTYQPVSVGKTEVSENCWQESSTLQRGFYSVPRNGTLSKPRQQDDIHESKRLGRVRQEVQTSGPVIRYPPYLIPPVGGGRESRRRNEQFTQRKYHQRKPIMNQNRLGASSKNENMNTQHNKNITATSPRVLQAESNYRNQLLERRQYDPFERPVHHISSVHSTYAAPVSRLRQETARTFRSRSPKRMTIDHSHYIDASAPSAGGHHMHGGISSSVYEGSNYTLDSQVARQPLLGGTAQKRRPYDEALRQNAVNMSDQHVYTNPTGKRSYRKSLSISSYRPTNGVNTDMECQPPQICSSNNVRYDENLIASYAALHSPLRDRHPRTSDNKNNRNRRPHDIRQQHRIGTDIPHTYNVRGDNINEALTPRSLRSRYPYQNQLQRMIVGGPVECPEYSIRRNDCVVLDETERHLAAQNLPLRRSMGGQSYDDDKIPPRRRVIAHNSLPPGATRAKSTTVYESKGNYLQPRVLPGKMRARSVSTDANVYSGVATKGRTILHPQQTYSGVEANGTPMQLPGNHRDVHKGRDSVYKKNNKNGNIGGLRDRKIVNNYEPNVNRYKRRPSLTATTTHFKRSCLDTRIPTTAAANGSRRSSRSSPGLYSHGGIAAAACAPGADSSFYRTYSTRPERSNRTSVDKSLATSGASTQIKSGYNNGNIDASFYSSQVQPNHSAPLYLYPSYAKTDCSNQMQREGFHTMASAAGAALTSTGNVGCDYGPPSFGRKQPTLHEHKPNQLRYNKTNGQTPPASTLHTHLLRRML